MTFNAYAKPALRVADIPELATMQAARTTGFMNGSMSRRLNDVAAIAGLNEPFQHAYATAIASHPGEDLYRAYGAGGTSLAMTLHLLNAAFPGITIQEAAVCAITVAADNRKAPAAPFATRWPDPAAKYPHGANTPTVPGIQTYPLTLDTEQDLHHWFTDGNTECAFALSADHTPWIVYANHDGDWYALRPLGEDDLPRWPHPANPADQGVLINADTLPLPVTIVAPAWR